MNNVGATQQWICPQCLMTWNEDIGKCPCTTNPMQPAFVTRLERFLASTDLTRLYEYFEEHFQYPIMLPSVLKQFEYLKVIKSQLIPKLIELYGEIREDSLWVITPCE